MLEWSLELSRNRDPGRPALSETPSPLDYTVTLRRPGAPGPERAGALRLDRPPPDLWAGLDKQREWARELGTQLRGTKAWAQAEQELREALQREPARLVLLSHADEVRAWPWEALPLGDTGPGLGLEAPNAHPLAVVHRAPGCRSALQVPPGPPRRVLVAWTEAGGMLEPEAHAQALREALPGAVLELLPEAGAHAVRERLEAAQKGGEPFDTLHLLSHGALMGGPMAEGDEYAPNAVDPWVDALRGLAPTLARVVLMACTQGDHRDRGWESLPARLHREGIQAVVACRWKVRLGNADRLTGELYAALARDDDEGLAVTRARQALVHRPSPTEEGTDPLPDDTARKQDALGLQIYQHAPPSPLPPPLRPPWLAPTALVGVLLGALAGAFGAGVFEPEQTTRGPSPRPDLPVVAAPAPRAALPLTLVYLDAPQAGEDRAATWARVLGDVLAQAPQAVLLGAERRPPGLDPAPLQAALRQHPQATVLGLLPNPEGGPIPPDLSPLLPGCAAGPAGGCVHDNLPVPALLPGQLDPTTRPQDEPLYSLTRCLGTTPTASLALARLAQDGTLPTMEDCRLGEIFTLPNPPADPCAGPYRWLWGSELARGPEEPPRDPWRTRGQTRCKGWAGLSGRLVLLSDPWDESPRKVLLGDDPTQIPLTQAEALALAAWATLGVMEEE